MSKAVEREGAVMRLDVKLVFDIRFNLRIYGTLPLRHLWVFFLFV
jgi:hypothetical protein